MVGTTLVFNRRVQADTDAMGNPTYEINPITVPNCLIAPMHEPQNAHEQQGKTDTRERLRIHMPKTSNDDVSGSTVVWDGKTYQVDNSSVKFMDENTPGQWNRYFMAEAING